MRAYALLLLGALALTFNACGSDQQATDGGKDARDGGADRGGTTGGAGRGGTGGSTAGTGGSAAGTGGAAAGTGGSAAGTGGSAAGTGGSAAGTGGSSGTGGSAAGTGGSTGTGGSAGRGGSSGTGGSTAGTGGSSAGTGGSTGTGGSAAGTGGSAGRGGSSAGTGGSSAGTGGSGGSTAGTGGSATGTGGSAAGTGGSTGTGGSAAGTGGSAAGTGGSSTGTAGSAAGTGGSSTGTAGSAAGTGGGTAGSTGGSGGGGGTGGTAGGGGTVACTSASTCPGGADTECQQKTCVDSFCGLAFAAVNTALVAQSTGDCKRAECDGLGGVMEAILDSDTPTDDGNTCTAETCVNGMPTHAAEPPRTACAQGGTLCNGSATAPACVVCLLGSDCPGVDTICHRRVCGNLNTCGFSNEPAGTAAEPDATGNCRKAVCDDVGGVTSTPDDADVPADDGNSCTDDVCSSGAPSHPAKADGTACTGPNGAKVCNSAACVQCLAKSDCPGVDTICRQFVCQNDHTCGTTFAQTGTAAEPDAAGNCHKAVCDGSGGVMSAVDDSDKLVDGNPCTSDVCTNGTASNPTMATGTLCASTTNPVDPGSKVCDANAACIPLTFRVVRIGPGTTNIATAVAVEEWQTTGGTAVSTVDMPAAASGGNTPNPFSMSGSATSEGCLSLSADGHYLALAGYGVAAGTPGSVKAMAGKRIAGLIDIAGAVDTRTRFDTAITDNVRAATTVSGTGAVWIAGAGAGTGTSGGVWSNTVAATTGELHTVSTPNNVRCVAIFGGQLYGSSGSGAFSNVFTIGTGTPTTDPQTATSLPGMPTSSASPCGFAIFGDTVYVADDRTAATGGGIQKWKFNGTSSTWGLDQTFTVAGLSTGFRGVAGYKAAGTVTLMASSAEDSPNHLYLFVDSGSGAPTTSLVATAPGSMVYRGVAVSPHFAAP